MSREREARQGIGDSRFPETLYRRLQRFFQHVSLPQDWSAHLVVRLLGLTGPWHLCLDRTNWKIGSRNVNILMLAIVTRRFRVPLMWTVLDKAGNSNAEERIALMRRCMDQQDRPGAHRQRKAATQDPRPLREILV